MEEFGILVTALGVFYLGVTLILPIIKQKFAKKVNLDSYNFTVIVKMSGEVIKMTHHQCRGGSLEFGDEGSSNEPLLTCKKCGFRFYLGEKKPDFLQKTFRLLEVEEVNADVHKETSLKHNECAKNKIAIGFTLLGDCYVIAAK